MFLIFFQISIFTEIPNIEVLTLSANKISSLEHISQCHNLTELYLRKNSIASISELYYLKPLTRLRVLWLSENPCCGQDSQKFRLTVLRNLSNLQKLDNQTVTEEDLSRALEEGEEITAPPFWESTGNGVPSTDNENDSLSFSMEETNKIGEQLGMKPLTRDKFPSFTTPKERRSTSGKKSNVLNAVLLLLKDLDAESLDVVRKTTENRLHTLQRKEAQLYIQEVFKQ
ncbi:cilia- and flagella-associated protein 410-like [Polyodon spathula]|uniref:cilia- and flagella-associated protein 410-like n=1 Tax=Polyodon spathula TaxID=7913 RepID=UPI001B7F1B67|nr:cilia- and flagella-associated protein 410-like [Polyodon spathula]